MAPREPQPELTEALKDLTYLRRDVDELREKIAMMPTTEQVEFIRLLVDAGNRRDDDLQKKIDSVIADCKEKYAPRSEANIVQKLVFGAVVLVLQAVLLAALGYVVLQHKTP